MMERHILATLLPLQREIKMKLSYTKLNKS